MSDTYYIKNVAKSNTETVGRIAARLAGIGWKVFPCDSETKAPLTKRGYKDATTNIETITAWWDKTPSALIGIPCEPNGFFALDVDRKNGVDGCSTLAELHENYSMGIPFGIEPFQKTPTSGFHYLFRLPDFDIPNNAGKLGEGLDLRSAGYICTGEGYMWLHDPETPIVDAPDWLLDPILFLDYENQTACGMPANYSNQGGGTTGDAETAEHYLQKYLGEASAGSRNDTGFRLATQLRDLGLHIMDAKSYMVRYQETCEGWKSPPYERSEAKATLHSAYSRPARTPAVIRPISQVFAQKPAESRTARPPKNGNVPHVAPAELPEPGVGESFSDFMKGWKNRDAKTHRELKQALCGTHSKRLARLARKYISFEMACGKCGKCREKLGWKKWRPQIKKGAAVNDDYKIMLAEGLSEAEANLLTSHMTKEEYNKFPNVDGEWTVIYKVVFKDAGLPAETHPITFRAVRLTESKFAALDKEWWQRLADVSDAGEKRASGKLIDLRPEPNVADGESHKNGKIYTFTAYSPKTGADKFPDELLEQARESAYNEVGGVDLTSPETYQNSIDDIDNAVGRKLDELGLTNKIRAMTVNVRVDLAVLRKQDQKPENNYIETEVPMQLSPDKWRERLQTDAPLFINAET